MFSLRAFTSLQIRVVSSANLLILASTDCGNFIPWQLVDCLILWARISTPNTNNKGLSGHPCRTPLETLKQLLSWVASVHNSTFYVPIEYWDPFSNNRTKVKAFKYISNKRTILLYQMLFESQWTSEFLVFFGRLYIALDRSTIWPFVQWIFPLWTLFNQDELISAGLVQFSLQLSLQESWSLHWAEWLEAS